MAAMRTLGGWLGRLGWLGGGILGGGIAVSGSIGSARAEGREPAPVNLLTAVPTTVAVSSTVDSAQILPAHLVDGDLKTAWNSRSGDLTGAWIAFRVPAGARVTSIKMTAGYTHVHPKLGDLFTQNARIKKVRVSRGGKLLREVALDPQSRALQEIAVNAPGGDFEIAVAEIVPGSKTTWREACVSELEVWGTPPPGSAPKQQAPAVRVASLDAPPTLTRAECVKAVFPAARGDRSGPEKDADKILETEEIGLSPDVSLCRIDHAAPPGEGDVTVEIAAVRRAPRAVLGKETMYIERRSNPREGTSRDGAVAVSLVPLTTTERAVLVAASERSAGPIRSDETLRSTLYRITATGLSAVLAFESTSSDAEHKLFDRCELRGVTPTAALPGELVLDCEAAALDYEDPAQAARGPRTTRRVETYRWTGARYERRPAKPATSAKPGKAP